MKPEADEIRTFTVPPEGIDRLDVWLAACCEGFSRARVQGLLKAGRVSVNGVAVARARQKVRPGDAVALTIPPPVPAAPEPEDIPLAIVFEDDDILVLDKPAGLVVHPAPGHPTGTLVNALLFHCPRLGGIGGVARPGIVHRLDQDTSGLMVVAKTEAAMQTLVREFASHANLRKTYLAVVHGCPASPQGRIENLIGRCPWDRKKMAVVDRNGKASATVYRVLAAASPERPFSIVQCELETGRTHQIRVHMATTLGCPIVGDAVYGRPGWDRQLVPPPRRQLLHAWRLELKHPVSRRPLAFEAPPPADFPNMP
ncbi:MAG: RluA family pseudouridine synthase [Kiritimatiellia bacterium]